MSTSTKINPEDIVQDEDFVARLERAGFSDREAKLILAEADTITTSPEDIKHFQRHFVDASGDVDVGKVDAFMHIHATKLTLDSYLPVLDARADNEDHGTALNDLQDTISLMDAAGYSAQEIAHDLNTLVKISKSFTPHPTEGLSQTGIKLARNLVSASEGSQDVRKANLKAAVSAIATSDEFGAVEKSNVVNEMDYSNDCDRIHNAGVNELDRQLEAIIYDVTGDHVDVNTDTAARDWDYDSDGKNNADGIAMMAKMATTMTGALKDLSANLETAKNSNISDEQRTRITTLQGQVDSVVDNLKHVHDRSREITENLANMEPEQREAEYIQSYETEYAGLFEQLETAYDHLDDRRGLGFYEQTLGELDDLRKTFREQDGAEQAAFAIDESYRTNSRIGFALAKGQTRHSDLVYIDQINNLFESDALWGLDLLHKKDREEIMQAGSFSQLDLGAQTDFFETVIARADEQGKTEQVVQILQNTNKLNFKKILDGGNGYPDQQKTNLDRMLLRGLFPSIFEEGIISDAKELAGPRQKFIADLLNMVHMKHMPLNEDRENLNRQGELTGAFNKTGGADNLAYRKERVPQSFRRRHETMHVMRPASDSERFGGSFTRLQAMDQACKVARKGHDMKTPVELMIGGGQSISRFGGDVDMYRRLIAQELKEILKEKVAGGEELDEYDHEVMIMATSLLYTEQGRTKRYSSATPHQVRDDFASKLSNQLKDLMDLRGDVPDNTFIDNKFKFSDAMNKYQRDIAEKAIDDYQGFAYTKASRDGKPTDDLLLDNYAENAGAPNLVDQQNVGARPGAGKAKGSAAKKKTSGKRAIGKDQTLFTMQSFHAGFFSSGGAMERFQDVLHDGKITQDDIDDLMNSPQWDEAIFSRNLIDAGRFNASHLYDRVSEKGCEDWTYDKAMEIGKEVIWRRDNENGEKVLHYAGDHEISQEELYLSKIYYDRALFLALTEAALTPPDEGVSMSDSLDDVLAAFRPKDNSLEITMGARTAEKWPTVESETLHDHAKNAPAYSLYYLVDQDISNKLAAGESKDSVMTKYGSGDPKQSNAFFHKISAAMRSGTLPHKGKWTGENTFGVVNRRNADMPAIIAQAKIDHASDNQMDFDLDG